MKSNLKLIFKFLFIFTFFLFTACNDKEEIPVEPGGDITTLPIDISPTTGINTGTEANNDENLRLNKVISSEKTTTNLSITVLDENNNTISNASLKIGNITANTNEEGTVLLENIEINKDFQVITTSTAGYTTSIKTITPSINGVTNVSITLVQPIFSATFDAKTGGVVSNDNLSIEFPTDAIADQNGDLFDGKVTTTVTYYDPTSETFNATIPGTLVGLDNNDTMQALISKGMIKVDLTDASGEELEIFEGKEATVTLPANDNDPETIDFWHLNEDKGIWVQTGTATKVNDTYITTVTHFSTYNLDVKVDPIDITFKINDSDGNPISNQAVTLIATHESGTYIKTISTDNIGEFIVINAPKNADYTINFGHSNFVSQCEEIILPAGIISETITKELVIDADALTSVRSITFEGTLHTCDNVALSNKIFNINILNENGEIDKITSYTDSEGVYSVSQLLCNYDTTSTYEATIIVFNGDEIITKNTELIFEANIIRNLEVCNGFITEINLTPNPNFSDYFVLSPKETTGIINLEVLDESTVNITQILIYDAGANLVGFYFGTTRTMNVSFLFENSYTMEIHTDLGIFSTEFTKVDN